jgi:hypothetical protein
VDTPDYAQGRTVCRTTNSGPDVPTSVGCEPRRTQCFLFYLIIHADSIMLGLPADETTRNGIR